MTDTQVDQAGAAAPVAPPKPPKPPKIRMDRGREFATVHGERTPDDPFKHVHFMQDGLPHDAHGILILDHPMLNDGSEEAEQLQRVAEKRIRRQLKLDAKAAELAERRLAAKSGGIDEDDEDLEIDADDEEADEPEPINLSMWLRGEQDVVWNEITQHIARKYKKRVNSIADAVVFLVEQGVAPKTAVAKKFKKFLD